MKMTTGKSEDYTTGSLIDCYYFLKNYQIICCDLSKKTILDTDPIAIKKLRFMGSQRVIHKYVKSYKNQKKLY